MKDIITWLRNLEQLATDIYQKAAFVFNDDPKLKKFLELIAEDEAWHYHVMGSAADFILSEPAISPVISIDKETHETIIKSFHDLQIGLELRNLSKETLLEKIIVIEVSEWNDIFYYVVNTLKEKTNTFKYPAAKFQSHIKKIEYYLETIEHPPDVLKKMTSLSPVWVENILIVDDEVVITELFESLLSQSGHIDVAHNGVDALTLISEKFYKLIITDIDMPVMDGISLYKKAVKKYPTLKKRFLFLTGDLSHDRKIFFNTNQIQYLEKPVGIRALKRRAAAILVSE